jgi:hypothetical protein
MAPQSTQFDPDSRKKTRWHTSKARSAKYGARSVAPIFWCESWKLVRERRMAPRFDPKNSASLCLAAALWLAPMPGFNYLEKNQSPQKVVVLRRLWETNESSDSNSDKRCSISHHGSLFSRWNEHQTSLHSRDHPVTKYAISMRTSRKRNNNNKKTRRTAWIRC